MRFISSVILSFLASIQVTAQSVGLGTTNPHQSAQLDITSTNKGLLPPRLTSAQRKAIINPSTGLLVYDTDKSALFLYDGVQWSFINFGAEKNVPPLSRTPVDNQSYFGAGNSVSIDGDYAIIGTNNGVNLKGSAYIFFRSNGVWQQQTKIVAADGYNGDCFGRSVSISGNTVVVGADGGADGVGAAYVFSRSGSIWTQQAKLVASDEASGDRFGYSCGISGDYITVGAPGDDITVQDQGSAYIFYKGSGWVSAQPHQAKLVKISPYASDQFGYSVSISGDYVLIGAPYDDINFSNQGSAFLYVRVGANWPAITQLTALIGAVHKDANFGMAVSLNGNYAIVGAPNDMVAGFSSAGTAFIYFGGNGWIPSQAPQAIINNPEPNTQDLFGLSVAINGNYVVIGNSNDDINGETDAGSARLYKKSGTDWNQERLIVDAEIASYAKFGYSAAISGFNLLVSAPDKSDYKGSFSFLNIE